MGVKANLEPNLSLALGTSVVSPLDQASGYATLANQGIHIDASPVRLVRDSLGGVVFDNRFPQETEVVSAGTAYIMTSMLEGVINEGTGYPNAVIGRPAAGKTGTTSNFRDAWFVGYTPDLVTAVWLGNDDYTQMSESYGGNIPARTWARFMKAALAKVPPHEFVYPASELQKIPLCGGGGKYEYYLEGTQPPGNCAYPSYDHRRIASNQPLSGATPSSDARVVSSGAESGADYRVPVASYGGNIAEGVEEAVRSQAHPAPPHARQPPAGGSAGAASTQGRPARVLESTPEPEVGIPSSAYAPEDSATEAPEPPANAAATTSNGVATNANPASAATPAPTIDDESPAP